MPTSITITNLIMNLNIYGTPSRHTISVVVDGFYTLTGQSDSIPLKENIVLTFVKQKTENLPFWR